MTKDSANVRNAAHMSWRNVQAQPIADVRIKWHVIYGHGMIYDATPETYIGLLDCELTFRQTHERYDDICVASPGICVDNLITS
jgi:hypothetical protein